MSLYSKVAGLRLDVVRLELEPLLLAGGFPRRTTVVRLHGDGVDGVGEDVSWDGSDQEAFQRRGPDFDFTGSYTLDEFSRRLDDFALYPAPGDRTNRLYRRWAFESAALDLALRQAGTSLARLLDIEPSPVRFVVSGGLGAPPSTAPLRRKLASYPHLAFKLDWSPDWSADLVDELAALGCVLTVDLKGHYHSPIFSGAAPDAFGYRMIAAGLAEAWIEDPRLGTAEVDEALAPYHDRITWDAPVHALSDIVALPFKPRAVNIKPSRFGFVSELFRVYDYCRDNAIAMYGGGQYELGPGRGQVEYLASLFHPDGANDVAPVAFHAADWPAGLPASPLAPAVCPTGFRWAD